MSWDPINKSDNELSHNKVRISTVCKYNVATSLTQFNGLITVQCMCNVAYDTDHEDSTHIQCYFSTFFHCSNPL